MGIKKIAIPMNKAKNAFVDWLKKNDATNIYGLNDNHICEDWDYYISIDGVIGDDLYTVYFMVWKGQEEIRYTDKENNYDKLTIDEFMKLLD